MQYPDDEAGSWIPQEREAPAISPGAAVIGAGLALATTLFLVIRAVGLGEATEAEVAYAAHGTLHARLWNAIGLEGARILAAVGAGVAVAATWLAGRRLWHSDPAGLSAAALMALSPWLLAQGSLALPQTILLAAALLALLAALATHEPVRVMAGAAVAVAVLIDIRMAVWVVPLFAIILLRGNIYATGQHLQRGLLQVALLPALALGVVALAARGDPLTLPVCLSPGHIDGASLASATWLGGGFVAAHPSILWFGGWGVLVMLALASLWHLGLNTRVARLPGRVQLRLPHALPRYHGRSLWLLSLVVLAPVPGLWLPLLMLALAGGIAVLGEDAPGFGLTLLLGLLGLGVAALIQDWGLVVGTGGTAGIPGWTELASCRP